MPSRLATLAIATAASFIAAGCSSSSRMPASPVPAALTDIEAARLGGTYLAEQNDRNQMLHSALRQCDGYLLAYTTVLDPNGKPPKESHLVIVQDNGAIRELHLNEE